MLTMRAVIGSALIIQGVEYLVEPNSQAAAWAMALSAFLAAGLLMAGFLTPFASSSALLGAFGIWFSFLPACPMTLFASKAAVAFSLTILFALSALGPGAFSADARLFGRREIIFPPVSER